ncbi:hypothetical protein LTR50_004949 [Elasticomyces elasticus]|nr:hypothetical protein LTR50_004949 [Elasticomyces elasticus]
MASQRKKVSTACLACRKRKTRCDGLQPECRTCQTYGSSCVYNLERDSRKTPSKAYISALKSRIKTLEDLLDTIVDAESSEARDELLRRVRQQRDSTREGSVIIGGDEEDVLLQDIVDANGWASEEADALKDMTSLLAHLHVDESGTVYSVGATSNVFESKPLRRTSAASEQQPPEVMTVQFVSGGPPHTQLSPTSPDHVAQPVYLTPMEHHLLQLYFTWQHPVCHLFSRDRFMRDSTSGSGNCCSPLLLAAVLAVGAHYSDFISTEQGDVYFARAKKLLEGEIERPSRTTCQALVLMGTREAGCGRERGSGWLYAGMGFRMGIDLGIHLDPQKLRDQGYLSAEDVEERAFTFWGSFVSDRGWTAYLGRTESLPYRNVQRDICMPERVSSKGYRAWSPYTDDCYNKSNHSEDLSSSTYECDSFKHLCQLVALLGSIVRNLYNKETAPENKNGPSSEIVSGLHTKLCAWHNQLPHCMRLSSSASPVVLLVHMFYHTALILLFRPFVRARQRQTSASRNSTPYDISPLEICTKSALAITRCLKQYQKAYTLRRYANWIVHAVLTASTIFVINATGTVSPCNSSPDATCSPEEAARKLEETMRALAEMSAAWTNAGRCMLQLHQWIEKYNIPIRPKIMAQLPQPNPSLHWVEPATQYEGLPPTWISDFSTLLEQSSTTLLDMSSVPVDYTFWPSEFPDFMQPLEAKWNVF